MVLKVRGGGREGGEWERRGEGKGWKRDKTQGEVEKRIVSQLLTLMDGIKGKKGGGEGERSMGEKREGKGWKGENSNKDFFFFFFFL